MNGINLTDTVGNLVRLKEAAHRLGFSVRSLYRIIAEAALQ
jgi:predicted DNA-binding transcriptional regulator AlpA